jgi:hypothetical protein
VKATDGRTVNATIETLRAMPVKLGASAKAHLAKLAKEEPVAGCEEQWGRYLDQCLAFEEASARYDVIYAKVEKEGGMSTAPSYEAFVLLGNDYDIRWRGLLGSLSAYLYAVEHVHDDKPVAEDELRAVVGASIEDNLGGLQINLKSGGLLAAKLAQAIRKDVIEFEFTDVPYCQADKP